MNRKTSWQVPHEWFDNWWEPSELTVAVDAERNRFARFEDMYRPELKPLLQACAAGTFATILSQDRPVQIRLERDRFPDFVLRVRGEVLSFELTEADREGRRRDEEYRRAAELLEQDLPLPVEVYDPDEEANELLEVIARAIEKKARKHYPSATNLLVYVNLSGLGNELTQLSAFQFADQWGGRFASCWLLWQDWIIRLWPRPCRIKDQRRA